MDNVTKRIVVRKEKYLEEINSNEDEKQNPIT